jgi:hypothetical protein
LALQRLNTSFSSLTLGSPNIFPTPRGSFSTETVV